MITVSLCMIVKNEENTLGRCLQSVKEAVDEIVIVDTGSTDATKEVAARFTDRIYDFTWIDDFSAARNASFDKATKDFILWLDADDILLPEDTEKLKSLKKTLPADADSVAMLYNTGFDSAGRVTFSYYRERMTRRVRGCRWREPVHEYLETAGKMLYADVCVTHAKEKTGLSDRNIGIYEKILAKGGALSPRGTFYYARELKDHARYADAIVRYKLFLDGGLGWIEDNITACGDLARCYQLINEEREILPALFRSFVYDAPRPPICCQLGYHYKSIGRYEPAFFWFESALRYRKPKTFAGFDQKELSTFVPCIECAVCCDMIGELDKAVRYNEQAALYKPDSPAVAHNRAYFSKKKAEEASAQG